MKKKIFITLILGIFCLTTYSVNAGPCTNTGMQDNGCDIYDCVDSFLIDCGDSKTVIVH